MGTPAPAHAPHDQGFSLVETLVSLAVVSVVLTAAIPLLVGMLQSTAGMGNRQGGLTVASQTLEYLRSVSPTKLLSGRSAQDVAALIAAPGLVDLRDDVTGTGNSDPDAALGSATAVVPLTSTQTVNSVTYTVRTYLNPCYLSPQSGRCTTVLTNGPAAFRVSVDVSWPKPAGTSCASGRPGQCEHVVTTVVDASTDPVFSLNPAPTIILVCKVVGAGTAPVISLRSGQQVTLVLNGTNFRYGAYVVGSGADIVGVATVTSGNLLTVSFQPSGTPGTHTLSVINVDGTSGSVPLLVSLSAAPDPPTALAAVAGDTSAALTWTAPANNGGFAITGYTVTAVPPTGMLTTVTQPCASSPCPLAGLTNGAAYSVTVTASNINGTSMASNTVSVSPYPSTLMTFSGLKLWLDGADSSTLYASTACSGTVTTVVGCWKDKSGNINHTTASSIGGGPSYGTRTINGLNVVTFNGSTAVQGAGLNPYGITGDRTLYVVTRERTLDTSDNSGNQGSGTYLSDRSSATNGLFSLKVCNSRWGVQIRDDSSGGATCITHPDAPSVNRVDVIEAQRSGTTDTIWRSAIPGSTSSYTGTITQAALTIGRQVTGPAAQDVDVAEVLLFNSALGTSQRRTIEDYLATKWGATLVAAAPTAAAATGNNPGEVSWTAPVNNGGSAITGYTATAVPSVGTLPTVTQACVSSPCTLTGLIEGATYVVTITATNAVGTGAASNAATVIPYPAVLTSASNRLWLDGADPATVFQDAAMTIPTTTAGQPIAGWKDKSGQGNNVAIPVTVPVATAPAADTTTFGGKIVPVISGGSTATYLVRATGFPAGSDYTEFAVYRATSAGCTNNIISGTSHRAFYTSGGGGLRVYHGGSVVSTGAGVTANTAYVASGTFVNSTRVATADVNAGTKATGTLTATTADAGIQIGAYSGAGNGFCGQIGEVSVFNRVLSDAERRTVEEYLSRKWGVTITPQAPTPVTATAGTTTAAVSWAAPGWNGGSMITAYTATSSPGGRTCTAVSPATGCTVTGLINGTAYTFTVAATNVNGPGWPSASSNSVTPI